MNEKLSVNGFPVDECDSLTSSRDRESLNQMKKITYGTGSINDDVKSLKLMKIVRTLTVEPYIFLYMFSFMLHSVTQKTLTMDKGCIHELNYSDVICQNLTFYEEAKTEVEKFANDYGMYADFIRYVPGTFVVIWMGSWSDKYGRKPPMVVCLTGAMLEDIGLVLNAIYYEAPVWYVLLSSIPGGLSGGFMCALSTTYSLASEQAPKEMRIIKFAIVGMALALGMIIGSLVGGIMSDYYSYETIFLVSAIGHAMAIPWVLFAITETRVPEDVSINWKRKLSEVFTLNHIVEGFSACLKLRPNKERCQIWLLLASICCLVVSYTTLSDITFIFTYHEYDWNNDKYSTMSAIFDTIGMFACVFSVPLFNKVFKMNDPILGVIGTVSAMAKNLCIAFAVHPFLFYLGSILGLLSKVSPLAVRSCTSKLLQEDELGKIFAFMAACESLIPVLASLMVNKMYNATVNNFAGAAFLPPAALLLLPIGTFIWLIMRKPVLYEHHPSSTDSK